MSDIVIIYHCYRIYLIFFLHSCLFYEIGEFGAYRPLFYRLLVETVSLCSPVLELLIRLTSDTQRATSSSVWCWDYRWAPQGQYLLDELFQLLLTWPSLCFLTNLFWIYVVIDIGQLHQLISSFCSLVRLSRLSLMNSLSDSGWLYP